MNNQQSTQMSFSHTIPLAGLGLALCFLGALGACMIDPDSASHELAANEPEAIEGAPNTLREADEPKAIGKAQLEQEKWVCGDPSFYLVDALNKDVSINAEIQISELTPPPGTVVTPLAEVPPFCVGTCDRCDWNLNFECGWRGKRTNWNGRKSWDALNGICTCILTMNGCC